MRPIQLVASLFLLFRVEPSKIPRLKECLPFQPFQPWLQPSCLTGKHALATNHRLIGKVGLIDINLPESQKLPTPKSQPKLSTERSDSK